MTTPALIDLSTLSLFAWLASFGALFAALGLCAVKDEAFDDGNDGDFDDEDLFDFGVSREDFEEYDAQTRESIARVEALR